MGPADDGSFEMADLGAPWPDHRFFDPLTLDEGTASRILDGLGRADVPPGYVDVANLLAAATAPADAAELESESTVVAAFLGEPAPTAELPIHTVELPTQISTPSWRRRPRSALARLATQKVAVAAVAGAVVVGGGVAAAATGSLPDAVQGVASHVLGLVGVEVPGPNASAGHHPDTRGSSGTPPPTISSAPGSPGCAAPCAGQAPLGASGPPGTGSSGAPVSTPNPGGTSTANTASKGASLAGATRADNASGGAGGAGSGNAGSHPPGGAPSSNGASGGGAGNAGSSGTAGSGNASAGTHPGAGGTNSSGQGEAHGKP